MYNVLDDYWRKWKTTGKLSLQDICEHKLLVIVFLWTERLSMINRPKISSIAAWTHFFEDNLEYIARISVRKKLFFYIDTGYNKYNPRKLKKSSTLAGGNSRICEWVTCIMCRLCLFLAPPASASFVKKIAKKCMYPEIQKALYSKIVHTIRKLPILTPWSILMQLLKEGSSVNANKK